MTQTASGTVADRGARAQVALGSLGWAVLASLQPDLVRANILLLAFQRACARYAAALPAGQIHNAVLMIPVDGQWTAATVNALALVTVPSAAVGTRPELVRTAGPPGTYLTDRFDIAGTVAAYFQNRLLGLAPMGDEQIWMVHRWANEVAPQDVQSHIEQRLFDYIEGGDADPTNQAVPLDAQRAGVPDPNSPRTYNITTPIHVPGIVPRGGQMAYWPWAVAGLGLVVLTGVLLFRKKRGRR